MKSLRSKFALLALLAVPLVTAPRGCSKTDTSPAQLACIQHYIQIGQVNSTTYTYYQQVCRQQAQ